VIVTLACAVPAGFVAVKTYVVVALGDTVTEPLSGNVSAPSISISGLTLTLVAFVLDQFSVASSPAVMVVLSAPADIVGACVNTCTVAAAVAVTPPGPFAVAV
jgi:hypothetical protein